MQDVSKNEGRTVLFVSHNMGAVTTLCRTGIWLDGGRVVHTGPARKIVDEYLTVNATAQTTVVGLGGLRRAGDYGLKLKIERLEWLSGLPLKHGEGISARIHFCILQDVDEVTMGIGFSTPEGTRLLTYETDFQDSHRPDLKAGTKCYVEFSVPELCLAPGIYSLDIGSRSGDFHALDYLPGFCQMEIAMGLKTPGTIVRSGAGVRLPSEWKWEFSPR
jgi:lipopolysaccharide transport system ATP-binding protein